MKKREKFDLVEITKRAILADRKKIIKHIIAGVKHRFHLDIMYAYLNPDFSDKTDYFIIAKQEGKDAIIIFHAISFGECSTTQFDMYASRNAIPEFYDNMMVNATCYPTKLWDGMLRTHGLGLYKSSDNYWLDGNNPAVVKKVIEIIDETMPELSHKKNVINTGSRN